MGSDKRQRILVATDLGFKGLLKPEVKLVVNFSVPTHCLQSNGNNLQGDFQRYSKRIVRTNFEGKSRFAITIITTGDEANYFDDIEAEL